MAWLRRKEVDDFEIDERASPCASNDVQAAISTDVFIHLRGVRLPIMPASSSLRFVRAVAGLRASTATIARVSESAEEELGQHGMERDDDMIDDVQELGC